MNHKAIYYIVILLLITGCAAREETVSKGEPKSLIIKDDYEDLIIKPRKEEPVEIDYEKEGAMERNIDTTPKISAEDAIQTKFLYIASIGSADELKIRYENGAKINVRNADGETALIKVLEGQYNDETLLKLKYLISVGAKVNFKGKSKRRTSTTPLDVAVWNSSFVFRSDRASKNPFFAEQILKYLIAEGADVSGSDEYGWTPLHTAAKSNNVFAAELLLESGAVVMQNDYFGRTPLHLADSREMKKILIEHGAVETEDPFPDFDSRKDTKERGSRQKVWEPLQDVKTF